MADQWKVFACAVPVSTDVPKSLIDISSGASSASIVRVYRVWHFDSSQTAVAGVLTRFTIGRCDASRARGNLAAIPAVSTSLWPAQVTCGSRRGGLNHVATFRQYLRDTNEWIAGVDNLNAWEFDVPMAEVWNAGYCDENVQPLTARPGHGIHVQQETTSGSTNLVSDLDVEFTLGSS